MSLLAIDIGSSRCKAVAFCEDGRVVAQTSCSYQTAAPESSTWWEMPVENFWQALVHVSQVVSASVPNDPVEVLAISSHGETFVPVDSRGHPLCSAILNIDNRAVAEANWLAQQLGRREVFDITGLAVHPMYPAAKILWLERNRAAGFPSSARFLGLTSYLLTQLGLPAYIDYSHASRFMMFDVLRRAWSEPILSACNVAAEQLPKAVPAGTIAGELTARVAGLLGLRLGTTVVVGGHDQPCAALGTGVIEAGQVSASLGTYECLLAASRNPALNERAFAANLNSYCHVVPDRYVTLAYFPAGIMLDWFLHLISSQEEPTPPNAIADLCARLESRAAQGPTGICAAPHLLGTGNPDFNPDATGVIYGVRPMAAQPDLYKAILEGIACEFAAMVDLLQEAAGAFSAVYVSGGGTRSKLGLQLRASLSGRELHLLECPEAVCLGTAILAGVATGKYANYADGVQRMVRMASTVQPDAALAAAYQDQMFQYRLLYSSLATVRRAQHEHI